MSSHTDAHRSVARSKGSMLDVARGFSTSLQNMRRELSSTAQQMQAEQQQRSLLGYAETDKVQSRARSFPSKPVNCCFFGVTCPLISTSDD